MSPRIPTTQEVSDQLVAQITGSLGAASSLLPKAFIRVLSKVLAGAIVLLYKYAGYIWLQLFVAHASYEETEINGRRIRPLVEWGRLVGEGDPQPATRAEFVVRVRVTHQTGTLRSGSLLVRPSTGVIYEVAFDVPLNEPTVRATLRASSAQNGESGAGAIGNLAPGDIVSFASPLPNVAGDATVESQTAAGADAEPIEAYRARILRRFARKPQGGAYADYEQWGESAAGIVRIYPYAGAPGEVDVYVEATVDSSGSPDGIATAAQLGAVRQAIEQEEGGLATRRPVNAAVNVYPIHRTGFFVRVRGLGGVDAASLHEALAEGIDEHLRSREPFIVGLSSLPRQDLITQAAVSSVVDTIVSAAGGTVVTVEVLDELGLIASRALRDGEKAKLASAGLTIES